MLVDALVADLELYVGCEVPQQQRHSCTPSSSPPGWCSAGPFVQLPHVLRPQHFESADRQGLRRSQDAAPCCLIALQLVPLPVGLTFLQKSGSSSLTSCIFSGCFCPVRGSL